ncbi:hypothetical protein [Amycolatopsis sp. cmx-11-32]|uniref:hypothetical protein n=1 Tax=Amycolatopsis sp. cmx-11-32 TaxID=2785796 RepID=UPI0039E3A9FA
MIREREREIELLGLQVTTPTPDWPGGWLIGSSTGHDGTAWIVPFDFRSTPDPVWRDRAAADAALQQFHEDPGSLRRRNPRLAGFTPARPPTWMPPAAEGDTGDYQVHWVGATRNHIAPGGLAWEVPLDLIGWQHSPPRPAPHTAR